MLKSSYKKHIGRRVIRTKALYLQSRKLKIMIKRFLTIAAFAVGMLATTGLFAQDDIVILINNETSRQQLFELRQELAASNINFLYTPEFNSERKLTSIMVEVTTQDGYSGNYQTSLMDDNKKVYIIRKFAADADTPFCVGDCGDFVE